MKCSKCEFTMYETNKDYCTHRTRFYDDDPDNLLPPFCPVCGHSFAAESTAENQDGSLTLSAKECLDVPYTGEILPQYWWVIHLMFFGDEIIKNWDDSYMEYAQEKRSLLVSIANEIYEIANKYVDLELPHIDDEEINSFFSEDVLAKIKSEIESIPLIVSFGAFSNVAPKNLARERELKSHVRNRVVFYLMEALDILLHEEGILSSIAIGGGNAGAALDSSSRLSDYWTAYLNLIHYFTEIEKNLDLDPDAYQDNLWLLYNHLATRVGYMDDLEAIAPKGDDSFDNHMQLLRDILYNDLVMVYDGILVNGTLEENLFAADWYRQWEFSKYFPKEEYLMMINAYIEDDWDHLESLKKYVEDMDC
ncbi:MAG: hypothetical protein K6E85_05470 [Lachnospiraceae bacterium]|nr:hypothetical protein [Lachnospiraceae bacterium]